MPRPYTVSFENVTLGTAGGDQDLLSVIAADDKPVALKSLVIKTITEVAEAQEEWLRIMIGRGHTTTGSGGSAATARPNSPIDTAFGGTARVNDTTIASAGTNVQLWADAFQVRAGYELFLPPEDWFWVSGTDFLVVRLLAAGADDVNASATFQLVEYP